MTFEQANRSPAIQNRRSESGLAASVMPGRRAFSTAGRVSLLLLTLCSFPPGLLDKSARANELDPHAAGWWPFIQRHCLDCHGADVQEAGLQLDQLASRTGLAQAERNWTKVLDKVASGQMPPQGEPRPAKNDVAVFARELSRDLHAASLDRQQREGRVVIRRLNRTEHETTLRDLLGPQVNVRELLPEENLAAGFDNVSEALDVSATHLLRYQEAGELAVRSVIPRREPSPNKVRHTGREITERIKTFSQLLDKSVRFEGDALIIYSRPPGNAPCATAQATEPGRYRMTASVSAVGTGGRPLPVLISRRGTSSRDDRDPRRTRDVPADRTVVIEEEFELDSRNSVSLTPWDLPSSRELAARNDVLPLEKYRGPGLVVQWVEIEGPLDDFPSAGYRRLFGEVPLKRRVSWNPNSLTFAPQRPREEADRLIRDFLPVAFRRPVSPMLARYFVAHAHYELDLGSSFEEAMTVAYTAIFASPHFLYLVEPLPEDVPTNPTTTSDVKSGRAKLDEYAIASRLSYFLWSSLPDAELLRLADEGTLRDPPVLRAQVERMLKDPKSRRFAENFAGQWLDLRELDATSPDPRIYGEFDEFLYWSMPRETLAFFEEVLTRDLPVTDFVHSSWTFLNQRLAQHYGIPGIKGGELRKVELPAGCHRGGVLTQAAILKVTADGTRTSPVIRGVWVLDRILGQVPPPPPDAVAAIEPDIRGTTTIRQQLDKHRDSTTCAACHQHIDPPGFALESFDPIGGWREFYRGTRQPRVELVNYPGRMVPRGMDVEMGGRMPDGRSFKDIDEYKQLLLADKEQLVRNMAQKLIIYATGADLQFADREVVERLVIDSRKNDYGFRSLLHSVVQSRLFLSK